MELAPKQSVLPLLLTASSVERSPVPSSADMLHLLATPASSLFEILVQSYPISSIVDARNSSVSHLPVQHEMKPRPSLPAVPLHAAFPKDSRSVERIIASNVRVTNLLRQTIQLEFTHSIHLIVVSYCQHGRVGGLFPQQRVS